MVIIERTGSASGRCSPSHAWGRSLATGLLVTVCLSLVLAPAAMAQESASPSTGSSPSPAPSEVPAEASAITLSPLTDEAYGFQSVVPDGWTDRGNGVYTRASASDDSDHTLLTLQAAPLAPDALWPSLQQRLGLTSPPQPVDNLATAALEWSLYHVDVEGQPVAVDLAMAQSAGKTYIVSLWASPGESASLHDAVFLPVLEAFAPLPEPTPAADQAYDSVDVTFPGGAADVTLAGTLTLPRSGGPYPGVVLLSGSGAQDRDESLTPVASIKPFALIADALSDAGVAVLRFDDRGVGLSTGDYAAASTADFTRDGEAAVRYLRSRPEIDPARVGVLGHSEGGLEVASMAVADPSLAFVVSMAGPAVPGVDLIVAQAQAIARVSGRSEARVTEIGKQERAILEAVRDGQDKKLRSLLSSALGKSWDSMTPTEQQQAGPRDAYVKQVLEAQLKQLRSPEFTAIIASDPGADWTRATVPVLALFGGKDVQVPAEQNAPALARALATDARALSTVVVFPDANHLFQPAVTGSPSEYSTVPQQFTDDFLPTLVDWVTARVSSPEASPAP